MKVFNLNIQSLHCYERILTFNLGLEQSFISRTENTGVIKEKLEGLIQ